MGAGLEATATGRRDSQSRLEEAPGECGGDPARSPLFGWLLV